MSKSENQITVSFVGDADIVADLSVIYELLYQSYGDYHGTFLVRRLPGLLRHLSDVVGEHLENKTWFDDHGAVFEFSDEDYEELCKVLNFINK